MKWRPISTAPDDDTIIIGAIFNAPWAESHLNGSIYKVWYEPQFNAYISSCRVMETHNGNTFDDGTTKKLHSPVIHEYIDHWIPMPELEDTNIITSNNISKTNNNINNDIEYITGSAIIRKNKIYSLEKKHHLHIREMLGDKQIIKCKAGDKEGYTTNKREYVDPFEAAKIANNANQTKTDSLRLNPNNIIWL